MKRLLALVVAFALPAIALGQDGRIGTLFREILQFVADVVNFLGPLLIAIALLAFFVSLVRYLYDKDNTGNSRTYLGYSILILFVMVSIWGIVRFIQVNLGIRDGLDQVDTPRVVVPPIR